MPCSTTTSSAHSFARNRRFLRPTRHGRRRHRSGASEATTTSGRRPGRPATTERPTDGGGRRGPAGRARADGRARRPTAAAAAARAGSWRRPAPSWLRDDRRPPGGGRMRRRPRSRRTLGPRSPRRRRSASPASTTVAPRSASARPGAGARRRERRQVGAAPQSKAAAPGDVRRAPQPARSGQPATIEQTGSLDLRVGPGRPCATDDQAGRPGHRHGGFVASSQTQSGAAGGRAERHGDPPGSGGQLLGRAHEARRSAQPRTSPPRPPTSPGSTSISSPGSPR